MLKAAIVLFILFSLVLTVLCFRMMKRALRVIKQKWAATAAYVPPQRLTTPPLELAGTPRNQEANAEPHVPHDDDFVNAMMGLNTADRVGNPFWGSAGSSRRSHDDE